MEPNVILAAGYTRQSKGKERSISEQEADIREACGEKGWQLREIYSDTVSASRFARKERTDWPRLMASVAAGELGVVILWEPSRGDRDLGPWADFLSCCRDTGTLIHVISHDRTYSAGNGSDWKALAYDGVDSAHESEKMAQRINRTIKSQATQGKPHGHLTYGYERIYGEHDRKFVRQQPDPAQAPIVVEIFTRFAGGTPIKVLADDLTARGVPAPKGAPQWERSVIRKILANVAYIGKRQWNAQVFDAVWDPLVDLATFYAVKRILEDPARKTTRPGGARWLLSYLAVCDVCGGPLSTQPHGDGKGARHPLYRCWRNACVFIRVDHLDAYVTGRVLRLMSEVTFTGDDREALELRGRAAEMQARLDASAREVAGGGMSAHAYAIIEGRLLPEIARLEKEADEMAIPLPMRGVSLGQWDELDIAVRREVIRAAYEIRIRKRATPGKGFDADRVIMTLRQESAAEDAG